MGFGREKNIVDHQVKYNSAATEPAWNDGVVMCAGL
jgi:hypothetical protein